MRHFFRLLWKWTVLLLAGVVILLALGVGLFRIIVPQAPAYRAHVEQLAEKVIGFPVAIESLSLEWDWLGPELILHDVRLLGPKARVVLVSADEVQVVVNLTDLFKRPLQPSRVSLIHPIAEMARDIQGNLMFSGVVLDSAQDEHELRDWRSTLTTLLTYAKTEIQQGELYWRTSGKMRAPGIPARWRFSPVNLRLESSDQTYTLQGDIGLPLSLGKQLRIQATATGPAASPESWAWQGELRGDKLQAQLIYWLLDVEKSYLTGSLSVQVKGEGMGLQPGLLHGSVHIEDMAQRVGQSTTAAIAKKQASGIVFQTIHSAFEWKVSPGNQAGNMATERLPWPAHWELILQGLYVQRGERAWPVSRWQITRSKKSAGEANQSVTDWRANIGFVRLDDVARVLEWLPDDLFANQKKLETLALQGDARQLHFSVHQQTGQMKKYAAQGQITNFGWSALDKAFPAFGMSGLDGEFAFSQAGGWAKFATRDLQMSVPDLFRKPLDVAFLDATTLWNKKTKGWQVLAPDIKLGNTDIEQINATLRAWLPADKTRSAWIDLEADYHNIDFAHKLRYFPIGIMSDNLTNWLDNSVISGHSPAGKLIMRGPLRSFPWPEKNQAGLFRVTGQLRDTVLAFDKDWPELRNINGELLFEGLRFEAHANQVTTAGIAVQQAQAEMTDMTRGLLTAQGAASLSLEQGVAYLQAIPVADKFTAYLEHIKLQGSADADIDLYLPLSNLADTRVQVNTVLHNTRAKVTGVPAPFESISGKLQFTGKGVSSPGFAGQWLGKPFSGKIVQQGKTRVYVTGQSAVDDLTRVFDWPIKPWLEGATGWQAELVSAPKPDIALELNIATQLTGIAVKLPTPFGKSEKTKTPLQLTLSIVDQHHASLKAQYANSTLRLKGKAQDDNWQLEAGKLVLGDAVNKTALSLPDTGLAVSGKLERINLDEWLSLFEPVPESDNSTPQQLLLPAWLESVNLEIGLFTGFTQSITDLHLSYSRQPDAALLKLQSQPLAGEVRWPLQTDGPGELPVTADFARAWLSLPPDTPKKPDTKARQAEPFNPTQFPALAITAQDLRIEKAQIGSVSLTLKPIPDGLALENLSIDGPQYRATASGKWVITGQGQRTDLTVETHSTAVEETLSALGFTAGMSADAGSITGQLHWPDSPFGSMLDTLDGQLHLQVEDGVLREVEPGAGRLFGLLSLSALPRRLLLDFSDFFSQGLSFDSISGDFILVDGNAYTSNLKLDAPAADILIVGRTGLGNQDFDQLAIVDAHVSSALPVAGALAAGPQAGAIMLLLTQLLNEPLEKASRRKYSITGPWSDPQVKPVKETETP